MTSVNGLGEIGVDAPERDVHGGRPSPQFRAELRARLVEAAWARPLGRRSGRRAVLLRHRAPANRR